VLGAISEFDKAMTVAKLRGSRERKRRDTGKCEGRKSHAERNPELVAIAKRLRRQKPKGGRMSLRAISAELATPPLRCGIDQVDARLKHLRVPQTRRVIMRLVESRRKLV
jgi:hypothetical protein